MLAQLVDIFGQTGLAVLYTALWACPLLGLGVGGLMKGAAYAGRWWPILLAYYLIFVLPVFVGANHRHQLFFCSGTLLGPLIGFLLAVGGLPEHLDHFPPPQDEHAGLCSNCGYDLTGNVSGKCPECGLPAQRSNQREP